eukprot:TRINITY_DN12272_c0_g1_i1.p1 TRINITY_DN12272_c0_g1~~TRINITY_DN12272_c0_g1_i1.p1  ORF type:complete len:281 (+),score=44.43 TRINITY_DN12272_c0_g1_i1:87-845(+)
MYQQCPPAAPPVAEPLPTFQREIQQQKARKKRSERKNNMRARQSNRRGLFGALVNVVDESIHLADTGISELTHSTTNFIGKEQWEGHRNAFYRNFRFPAEERFWQGFVGSVVNGTTEVSGTVYISDHYLSFWGTKRVDVGVATLAFVIPLRNIASIQQCIVSNPNSILAYMPGSAGKPNGLMIYSRDGTLHTFYGFYSTSKTYNVLDHAWRASFNLITPGFQPIHINQQLPSVSHVQPVYGVNTTTTTTNYY